MSNYANVQAFSSVLTTGLDSRTDGQAASAASADQDNSTNLYGFADVSLVLGNGSTDPSVASARYEIHILPRLADGTTFADLTASTIVGVVVVVTGDFVKNGMLRQVPIPPGVFKWQAVNRMGVTAHSSGNTMSVRYYDMKGG